jgi:uncharacterized protein (DUF4415 family)
MPVKERAIKSDLARIDKLRDEQIDYSDIPELDDEVFAQPLVDWPPKKEAITIRVDSDVLGWFKEQGRGYQTRMNQVLRRYMNVAGRRDRPAARTRRKVVGEKRASKRTR